MRKEATPVYPIIPLKIERPNVVLKDYFEFPERKLNNNYFQDLEEKENEIEDDKVENRFEEEEDIFEVVREGDFEGLMI